MVLNRQGKLEKFREELATLNAPRKAALEKDRQQWEQQLQQKKRQVKAYKDDYIKETDGTGGHRQDWRIGYCTREENRIPESGTGAKRHAQRA